MNERKTKNQHLQTTSKRGSTLIMLVLAVALLTIMGVIIVPAYTNFQHRNDLDIAVSLTAEAMRRAQVESQALVRDSEWSVHLSQGKITIFQGNNWQTRDSNFDQSYAINSRIIFSGLIEVVFKKTTGFPVTSGTLIFSAPNQQTRSIIINYKGFLSYE